MQKWWEEASSRDMNLKSIDQIRKRRARAHARRPPHGRHRLASAATKIQRPQRSYTRTAAAAAAAEGRGILKSLPFVKRHHAHLRLALPPRLPHTPNPRRLVTPGGGGRA